MTNNLLTAHNLITKKITSKVLVYATSSLKEIFGITLITIISVCRYVMTKVSSTCPKYFYKNYRFYKNARVWKGNIDIDKETGEDKEKTVAA